MQRLNKGFLLVDALMSIFIVSLMAVLCISVYSANLNYLEGYDKYIEETKEMYKEIYSVFEKCEKCEVQEE